MVWWIRYHPIHDEQLRLCDHLVSYGETLSFHLGPVASRSQRSIQHPCLHRLQHHYISRVKGLSDSTVCTKPGPAAGLAPLSVTQQMSESSTLVLVYTVLNINRQLGLFLNGKKLVLPFGGGIPTSPRHLKSQKLFLKNSSLYFNSVYFPHSGTCLSYLHSQDTFHELPCSGLVREMSGDLGSRHCYD